MDKKELIKELASDDVKIVIDLLETNCVDQFDDDDLEAMCLQAGVTPQVYNDCVTLALGTLRDLVNYLELNETK